VKGVDRALIYAQVRFRVNLLRVKSLRSQDGVQRRTIASLWGGSVVGRERGDHRLRAVEEGRCAEEPAPTSSRRSRQEVNTMGVSESVVCNLGHNTYSLQFLLPKHPSGSRLDHASPYYRSA
jgi:hypothetical protein